MSLTVRYYPDASADFEAAVERYGSVSTEILERFLAEVDEAIDGIMLWPEAAPMEPSWTEQPPIRRARVKGFPYRLVYFIIEDVLWVLAVAHEKRKPGYWLDRLSIPPE